MIKLNTIFWQQWRRFPGEIGRKLLEDRIPVRYQFIDCSRVYYPASCQQSFRNLIEKHCLKDKSARILFPEIVKTRMVHSNFAKELCFKTAHRAGSVEQAAQKMQESLLFAYQYISFGLQLSYTAINREGHCSFSEDFFGVLIDSLELTFNEFAACSVGPLSASEVLILSCIARQGILPLVYFRDFILFLYAAYLDGKLDLAKAAVLFQDLKQQQPYADFSLLKKTEYFYFFAQSLYRILEIFYDHGLLEKPDGEKMLDLGRKVYYNNYGLLLYKE